MKSKKNATSEGIPASPTMVVAFSDLLKRSVSPAKALDSRGFSSPALRA